MQLPVITFIHCKLFSLISFGVLFLFTYDTVLHCHAFSVTWLTDGMIKYVDDGQLHRIRIRNARFEFFIKYGTVLFYVVFLQHSPVTFIFCYKKNWNFFKITIHLKMIFWYLKFQDVSTTKIWQLVWMLLKFIFNILWWSLIQVPL